MWLHRKAGRERVAAVQFGPFAVPFADRAGLHCCREICPRFVTSLAAYESPIDASNVHDLALARRVDRQTFNRRLEPVRHDCAVDDSGPGSADFIAVHTERQFGGTKVSGDTEQD